jgi:RNA polymerase sigma factor (sigma-70 family)
MRTSEVAVATTAGVNDLLLRAGDGDPAAWGEIVRRYSKLVFSKVRSFRLQDADAHDAVQATWLRLAENWRSVQHPEHLGGWLTTVASRECLRILNQAKRAPTPTDTAADDVADPSTGPEQHVVDGDTVQAVWNLVAELPPRRRILLRALFTDNPGPYTEVAHITGLPIGSIGPTRARALKQLRRAADERGLGQAV